MVLDFSRFFEAANPTRKLNMKNAEDQQYYIDFAAVRGGKIIQELKRTITRLSPNQPTCQLFTGHIGCGKSTELLRLKNELEDEGFHVVYFEASQDLDIADADISDILLAIARQVSQSLEKLNISLHPSRFRRLLQEATQLLNSEVTGVQATPVIGNVVGNVGINADDEQFSLSLGIGEITTKAKDSYDLRKLLRQYTEPRVNVILEAINNELFQPAIAQLKQRGDKGLVVIIDNLDRIYNTQKSSGRTQAEYLFVDRGEQLNQLHCHVVYTIPHILVFSNDFGQLINRFGIDPKVLPMVKVRNLDGTKCEEGIELLRQMILARAFPEVPHAQRQNLIPELFDSPETLDRLCLVSGGHVRNLLVLLYTCLQKDDPPFERDLVEDVISQRRNELTLAITPDEWKSLKHVAQTKTVRGEEGWELLLRSLFVFEYRDRQAGWFDINPVLAEAKELQNS